MDSPGAGWGAHPPRGSAAERAGLGAGGGPETICPEVGLCVSRCALLSADQEAAHRGSASALGHTAPWCLALDCGPSLNPPSLSQAPRRGCERPTMGPGSPPPPASQAPAVLPRQLVGGRTYTVLSGPQGRSAGLGHRQHIGNTQETLIRPVNQQPAWCAHTLTTRCVHTLCPRASMLSRLSCFLSFSEPLR